MDKYFSNNPRFTHLESDSTEDIISKVSNSLEKWLEVGEINADDIKKRSSSIPDHFLSVSWDIEAMSPSINNTLGMEACRKALDKREKLKPSVDCIMKAIELTFKNNNSTFNGKHYLQKHGTAMGPKNACSHADISVSDIDN